jgi:hypothetical protein
VARTATHSAGERVSIFAVAFGALAVVVGGAFAVGWLIGRLWL